MKQSHLLVTRLCIRQLSTVIQSLHRAVSDSCHQTAVNSETIITPCSIRQLSADSCQQWDNHYTVQYQTAVIRQLSTVIQSLHRAVGHHNITVLRYQVAVQSVILRHQANDEISTQWAHSESPLGAIWSIRVVLFRAPSKMLWVLFSSSELDRAILFYSEQTLRAKQALLTCMVIT